MHDRIRYKTIAEILEVSGPTTRDQITKNYKRLAKKYHPDIDRDNPYAEENMKTLNIAYEIAIGKRVLPQQVQQRRPTVVTYYYYGGGFGTANSTSTTHSW